MALSDEERTEGIYNCLVKLNSLSQEIKEDTRVSQYKVQPILNIIDQTWHAFLGKPNNSDSGDTITNQMSPWAVAIRHHMVIKDVTKYEFDAREFCSILNILRQNSCYTEAYIYQGYQIMESLTYPLRQYKDDYFISLSDLDSLVSQYQGIAYNAFVNSESFAKAYLIQEIIKLMYQPDYLYNKDYDLVTQVLVKDCVHHSFPCLMKKSLENLKAYHIRLVKSSFGKKFFEERLFVLLDIHDGLYKYSHILKDFLKNSMKDSLRKRVITHINKNKIIFDKNEKKKDAEISREYNIDTLNVYGYDGYEMLESVIK